LLITSLLFISIYIWTQVKDEDLVITPGNFKLSAVMRNVVPMFIALGTYIGLGGEGHVFPIFGLLTLYYVVITQQWSPKKLLGYIRWDVLAWVGAVIILGNYFKSYNGEFLTMIKSTGLDPHTFVGMLAISVIGFVISFLMGSSGKFIAVAVLMAQVFGVEYFLWFFAIDFAGYLLSPTHKCVMIGNRYFGTPVATYYTALGIWGLLLLAVSATITFLI